MSLPDEATNVGHHRNFVSYAERRGSTPNLGTMAHPHRGDSPSILSSTGDLDEAGARLTTLSLDNSPVKNLASSFYNREQARICVIKDAPYDLSDDSQFQLGEKPSGDVFVSSPGPITDGSNDNGRALNPEMDETVAGPNSLSSGGAAKLLRTKLSNLSGRHQVGGVDAQGVYPATACVFVANLPQLSDDRSLEAAVTREFSKYGTVFVKIRRDVHQMPFAFCQYTKDEDAKAAMELGKGGMILGRPCRTEMVKANRTFFIQRRRNCSPLPLEEARSILEQFGDLSRVEIPSAEMQESMGIQGAVIVEFTTFDPNRDLQSAFRHNDTYRVDVLGDRKPATMRRPDADEAFLNQYEIDRRSIFVGNLPEDIDEKAVNELFSNIGTVVKAQVIKKAGLPATRTFGFVEFDRPDTPEAAVAAFNNYVFEGCRLRVERKVVREHTPRRVRSQYLPSLRSPGVAPTNMSNLSNMAPTTPEKVDDRYTKRAEAVGQSQSTPVSAQMGPPTFPWTYPPSPSHSSFSGQGYMTGPASPYGPQVGLQGVPITPQATPDSFNQYAAAAAAYYGLWPGVSFVQNPLAANSMAANPMAAAMAPYYAAYSPTASTFARDNTYASSPTRVQHVKHDAPANLTGSSPDGSKIN